MPEPCAFTWIGRTGAAVAGGEVERGMVFRVRTGSTGPFLHDPCGRCSRIGPDQARSWITRYDWVSAIITLTTAGGLHPRSLLGDRSGRLRY